MTQAIITDNEWYAGEMAKPHTITIRRDQMERLVGLAQSRLTELKNLPGGPLYKDLVEHLRQQVPDCFAVTYQGLD